MSNFIFSACAIMNDSMSVKPTVLSFTTFLPSPILKNENDVSLRIYEGLQENFNFIIFKSLNILPFFSKRYRIYSELKRRGKYNWNGTSIGIYTLPNFKDPVKYKLLYFGFLYRLFFRKKISKLTFDAIHSNNIIPDFLMGVQCAKETGKPHFCTVRGKQKDVESILALNSKFLSGVQFCTPSPVFLELFRKKGVPIKFIPHGINDRYFNLSTNPNIDVTDSIPRFIIVNRLIKMKQISSIIDFFHYLKNANFFFQCDIIGDGEEMESLVNQVKRLELEKFVRFEGHQPVDEVAIRLKSADFYFTNSQSETFGLSIVEALAAGCMIVGPRDLGIIKVFNDMSFFIEFGKYESVVNSLKTKFRDRKIIKKEATTFAKRFKWDHMLQNYKDFLNLKKL